jgi:hypothetical protein
MRGTIKVLAAGLLTAAGLTLTGDTASAQTGGYRPYQPPAGPIRVQPQYPPVIYPQPYPRPYPGPYVPPVVVTPRYDTDYLVMVRTPLGHWHVYGKYETHYQARQVEYFLEQQGRVVKIERVLDGRGW